MAFESLLSSILFAAHALDLDLLDASVLPFLPPQYSSAAPLSADARQRICSELFDLKRFVTVSLTVGPASGVLKDKAEEQWTPREVALTVLVDRWASLVKSSQGCWNQDCKNRKYRMLQGTALSASTTAIEMLAEQHLHQRELFAL